MRKIIKINDISGLVNQDEVTQEFYEFYKDLSQDMLGYLRYTKFFDSFSKNPKETTEIDMSIVLIKSYLDNGETEFDEDVILAKMSELVYNVNLIGLLKSGLIELDSGSENGFSVTNEGKSAHENYKKNHHKSNL